MPRLKYMKASRYKACVTLSLRNQGTQVLYHCGKEGMNAACLIPHVDLLRPKILGVWNSSKKEIDIRL